MLNTPLVDTQISKSWWH